MAEKHLHIVCYDVPYPVNYGGVYDLFYKIKTLSEEGVNIHLHCFEYGRGVSPELEKYCTEVKYYERLSAFKCLTSTLPYIVSSRANEHLLANLKKDDHPILMEGVHCTYYLHTGDLPKNRCFVRLPNVEHLYYKNLAETTSSLPKKWYYLRESKLLYDYEKSLANKANFWTISQKDCEVFNKELGYENVDNLPIYLPEYTPAWHGLRGSFCLYHGNLSVDENEYAATWLLEHIFSEVKIPFVIAGQNPSKKLEKLAHEQMHTCIVSNPGDKELEDLIRKAQVNILPSFNSTGIKLKLINSLYYGRHCLLNSSAVEGSGLDECCSIANTCAEMKKNVQDLFEIPFTKEAFENRMGRMNAIFNNKKNADQMIGWIFNGEPTYPGYSSQR
ncbi:MAG: glycosyltransferase [Chitinophagaceae bacterium]|nr:glycosyltransferase [Chitinophagaceae bacterium]